MIFRPLALPRNRECTVRYFGKGVNECRSGPAVAFYADMINRGEYPFRLFLRHKPDGCGIVCRKMITHVITAPRIYVTKETYSVCTLTALNGNGCDEVAFMLPLFEYKIIVLRFLLAKGECKWLGVHIPDFKLEIKLESLADCKSLIHLW